MKIDDKKSGAGLLIFLGWLMYATSYLGKVNYSANITQIIDFYQVSKPDAGMPPTFFFFAYGIGQVVNGILCRRYNMKYTIFTSLILSAIINLVIALTPYFGIIKWLWLINGFVLSMLWPTLIRLITESLPTKELGRSSVVLGTTVAIGTLIIYGLSSIYAIFDGFKLAFYTAALADTAVAIVWLLLYSKAVSAAKAQRDNEILDVVSCGDKHDEKLLQGKEKKLLIGSVCVLCFCAIGVNLIKDGLTTWVPSILKDEYSITDSLSILLTLSLPIVAVFGNAYALAVHRKIPDYINHCLVIFITIGIFIGLIVGSLQLGSAVIMLFGLIITSFFASSLNSLITSIFPMFMRGKVNSGLYAGILNGFCYLGSTISSYGLGYIAEKFNWMSVFFFLIFFCIAICVACGGYNLTKYILSKK